MNPKFRIEVENKIERDKCCFDKSFLLIELRDNC